MTPSSLQAPPRVISLSSDVSGLADLSGSRVDSGPRETQKPRILGLPPSWFFLAAGAILSNLFALPVLSFCGWFIASLAHEMGHSLAAWLCGMPAFPAIRLDGHAAAMWSAQTTWLVFALTGLLGYLAWRVRHIPVAAIALLLVTLLQPVIAFTGASEFFCLAAGHGGELLFAGICFWRTVVGGFTGSEAERCLYATLGWYLLAKNLTLFSGLMTSFEAIVEYHGSGSFGMTNDLIRIAEDVVGWPLQSVATLMFVITLTVLPVSLMAWRVRPQVDPAWNC
ncbi:MAG: hypothetical protein V2A76_04550 [Planctomycetota bacterium]